MNPLADPCGINTCALCGSDNTILFSESENREYHHCGVCDVVFVPSRFFISQEAEKAKYDNHKNTPEDNGYCTFLDKLLVPLQSHLKHGDKGLDFGSGPGPTLSVLMAARGHEMAIYDVFYHDKREVFTKEYDFITSTEVIEHLHHPLVEIEKLWTCLKKGGVLGLMTAFRVENFSSWYYKRDMTHIIFFTPRTFSWIAEYLKAELIVAENGMVILKKGLS